MATANDLATAVNTYVKAARDEAIGRIKSLNTKAAGYMGSYVRYDVYNAPLPALPQVLISSSAGASDGGSGKELAKGIDAVNTRVTTGTALINSIDVPPDVSFTDTPLDGWQGVDAAISQPWDSVLRLNTQLWTGEGLKKAYALVSDALSGDLPQDFGTPLYDRSVLIFNTLRNSMRVSSNPRLQNAQVGELNRIEGLEQTDITRTISTMLEAHAREMYIQAASSGVELDKIDKMFSIKYGEIYAKLTDALVTKAGREVDWFTKDFLARAEMMSKSAGVNNSIYLDTLQSAVDTLVKEVETNIKVYMNNFEISLNVELEKFKFDKLDKNYDLAVSELDMSLFKARLNDMYQSASEGMEDYTNFHTLEVQAYLALARGYSGLLSTASQGTLAVATSKG